VYAFWALKTGKTPDEVDAMPVAWSAGWLLERMLELEGEPEKWKGQQIGFGLDDPDWDPAFDAVPDVGNLPFYEPEEVSDGE
jgi:hypothetical protein